MFVSAFLPLIVEPDQVEAVPRIKAAEGWHPPYLSDTGWPAARRIWYHVEVLPLAKYVQLAR
jgi:hypothetical protein